MRLVAFRRAIGPAVAAALVLGGCADDPDESTGTAEDVVVPTGSSESSPFQAEVPAGFEPVVMGRGAEYQQWDMDCCGSDVPLTVLVPEGEGGDSPNAAVVAAPPFQGNLVSSDRVEDCESEEFEVDGRPAAFTPAADVPCELSPTLADVNELQVAAPDADDSGGIMVRVRSAGLGRDQLEEIARRVEIPDDQALAPAVPDPPGGLEVVGSLSADVVVASSGRGSLTSIRGEVPGPESAHVAAFTRAGESITVMTLPGRSGSPAVADAYSRWAGRPPVTIDHPAVESGAATVTERVSDDVVHRRVVAQTPWDDLAVVRATASPDSLSVDELLAIVTSMRQVTPDEWDRTVALVTGGGELRPDPSAVELARGRAGDIEWLFQAVPAGALELGGDTVPRDELLPDPCLKLSTGDRACAREPSDLSTEEGTEEGEEGRDGREDVTAGPSTWCRPAGCTQLPDARPEFPRFHVVWTDRPGATVEFVTTGDTVGVDLLAVPGSPWRGAVVFDVVPACGTCPTADEPRDRVERIDVLDESGHVIDRIG